MSLCGSDMSLCSSDTISDTTFSPDSRPGQSGSVNSETGLCGSRTVIDTADGSGDARPVSDIGPCNDHGDVAHRDDNVDHGEVMDPSRSVLTRLRRGVGDDTVRTNDNDDIIYSRTISFDKTSAVESVDEEDQTKETHQTISFVKSWVIPPTSDQYDTKE